MDYVIVWFIMTGSPLTPGYIEPLHVKPADMTCSLPGIVVGVQVDRPINPTRVLWPDPKLADRHCRVDISARVATLGQGEYHIATTIMGKSYTFGTPPESYIGHDPHTTATWRRGDANTPGKPGPRFRVEAQPQ